MREIRISRNMINTAVEMVVGACSGYAVSKSLVRIFSPKGLLAKIACIGVSQVISEVVINTVTACGLTDDITDLVIKALKKRENVIITDKIPQETEEESVETSDISTEEDSEEEEKTEESAEASDISTEENSVTIDKMDLIKGMYVSLGYICAFLIARAIIRFFMVRKLLSRIAVAYVTACVVSYLMQNTMPVVYRGIDGKEAIA